MSRRRTTAEAAIAIAIFAIAVFSLLFSLNDAASMKFTNLQCEAIDPKFLTFTTCKLKVVRRGVVSLNIVVQLHETMNTCVVTEAQFKKASGYRPYFQNYTYDFCELQKSNKASILGKIAVNFIKGFSNLNHSCPYDHDLIFKELILSEDQFRLIPFPSGDYMKTIEANINGELRCIVKVFYSRVE